MRSYDCLMGMHAHEGEVCCVQFSVDETTIYSMGSDGKVILSNYSYRSLITSSYNHVRYF